MPQAPAPCSPAPGVMVLLKLAFVNPVPAGFAGDSWWTVMSQGLGKSN